MLIESSLLARALVIDTSAEFASVLLRGREQRVLTTPRNAEGLLRQIDEVLDGGRPTSLIIGLGPGSYTGIRIGISLVQGLALAFGCPVVGVASTLGALCLDGAPVPGTVRASIPARAGELYAVDYEFGDNLELLKGSEVLIEPGSGVDRPLAQGLLRAVELIPGSSSSHFAYVRAGEPILPIYGRGVQARTIAERKGSG